MEKLSLEKFKKFEMTENSAFKVKGGDNDPSGPGVNWTVLGDVAAGDSYDSDTVHDERGSQRSWVSTDMSVKDIC
jgi:hypothetical protein